MSYLSRHVVPTELVALLARVLREEEDPTAISIYYSSTTLLAILKEKVTSLGKPQLPCPPLSCSLHPFSLLCTYLADFVQGWICPSKWKFIQVCLALGYCNLAQWGVSIGCTIRKAIGFCGNPSSLPFLNSLALQGYPFDAFFLQAAADAGNFKNFKWLLSQGATIDSNTLFINGALASDPDLRRRDRPERPMTKEGQEIGGTKKDKGWRWIEYAVERNYVTKAYPFSVAVYGTTTDPKKRAWLQKFTRKNDPKVFEPAGNLARKGDIPGLEFLLELFTASVPGLNFQGPDSEMWGRMSYMISRGAAASGHVNVIEWIAKNKNFTWIPKAATFAARAGHLDFLKQIHENEFQLDSSVYFGAAEVGDFEILQWALDNEIPPEPAIYSYAAVLGDHRLLEWIRNKLKIPVTSEVIECLFQSRVNHPPKNYFFTLNWCYSHVKTKKVQLDPRIDCFRWVVEYFESPDILEWFRRKFSWNEDICAFAAKIGNFPALKFLRKYKCPWDEETVMTAAIGGGNLAILTWLLSQKIPIPDDALQHADNFETIKFLHENGHSLTQGVAYTAARDGDLETVKFVTELGIEVPSEAFDDVYCQWGVLSWLLRNGHGTQQLMQKCLESPDPTVRKLAKKQPNCLVS
jgi:hypothetical protein